MHSLLAHLCRFPERSSCVSSIHAAFLGSVITMPLLYFRTAPLQLLPLRAYFTTRISGLSLGRVCHFLAELSLLRSRLYLFSARHRNLDLFPFGYPFQVHLRSGLPWADDPSPGTLGRSGRWILTIFSLLMPTSALVSCPRYLTIPLRSTAHCSPTCFSTP